MLRCTKCGSENEFEVDEVLHHLIIVQVGPLPDDYLVKEEGDIKSIDWQYVKCLACGQEMDEWEARDNYEYEETDHAPDATPQPGPLAQP